MRTHFPSLSSFIHSESEPLEFYGQIIGKITEGTTKSIPKSDGYYKVAPVPWWNANCANLKKDCLKAQKQTNRRPMVSNKIKYKHLLAMFQRTQKDSQISSWRKNVFTLNSSTEDAKVWKKVDKIKGKYQPNPAPTLKVNGTTLTKPKEVASVLAEHYASASVKTKNLHRTEHNRALVKRRRAPFSMRGGRPDNVLLNAPFTLKEMETQLDRCKDSAPGPDDITISMMKHLRTLAKHTLLKALNKLWEAIVYPEQWSKEIKLPFLKPGKDPNLPSSYRPISLKSCICKLFERMVNHRLMWFLEKNNFLCPEQSGFRKRRSTIDVLTQLTCHIEKGFKEKKHTVAVFFDQEKAYDSMWRPEILSYMHEIGLRGNLLLRASCHSGSFV